MPSLSTTTQEEHLAIIQKGLDATKAAYDALAAKPDAIADIEDAQEAANAYAHELIPLMEAARAEVDALEILVPTAEWPVPSYNKILFYV